MKRLSWKKPFLKAVLEETLLEVEGLHVTPSHNWTFRKRKRQSQDAIFHTLGCRQDLRCALSVEISFTVWHSSLLLHLLAESRRIWQNLASRRAGSNFLKLCHLDATWILSWIPLWSDGELPMLRRLLDWLARRTCKIYCTDIQDWFWPDSVLHTEAVAANLSWTPLNASFLATVAREDSFKVCICGGATSIGASEAVWLTWVERIWHWHVWHVIT